MPIKKDLKPDGKRNRDKQIARDVLSSRCASWMARALARRHQNWQSKPQVCSNRMLQRLGACAVILIFRSISGPWVTTKRPWTVPKPPEEVCARRFARSGTARAIRSLRKSPPRVVYHSSWPASSIQNVKTDRSRAVRTFLHALSAPRVFQRSGQWRRAQSYS